MEAVQFCLNATLPIFLMMVVITTALGPVTIGLMMLALKLRQWI